jgi:Poly A polymerase head domain
MQTKRENSVRIETLVTFVPKKKDVNQTKPPNQNVSACFSCSDRIQFYLCSPILNRDNLPPLTPNLNQLASSALSIRYFQIVSKESERLNLDTYVIGGYVRDLILCRVSKDADFVTIGDCYPLAEAVAKRLGKESTINVFRHFGTAQVKSGLGPGICQCQKGIV